MNKDMNKSNPSQASMPQRPKVMRVSSPQQPKTTQVPSPQQLKISPVSGPQQPTATPVPATQQAHGILRPRPAGFAAPTHDDIAKRAYEIYIEKGCPEGQSEQIWTQAEKELKK